MSNGVIGKPLFSKMLQFVKFLRRSELKDETSKAKGALPESVEKFADTENIQNQITEAIRSKCKVELNYKGAGLRIVCPHAVYISPSGISVWIPTKFQAIQAIPGVSPLETF